MAAGHYKALGRMLLTRCVENKMQKDSARRPVSLSNLSAAFRIYPDSSLPCSLSLSLSSIFSRSPRGRNVFLSHASVST